MQQYDVMILGAGPAGLSAGIYAARAGMSTLILEMGQDGGQIATTDEIANYPGQMLEGESGITLSMRMAEQALRFGAHRATDIIESADLLGEVKVLRGQQQYSAKALIVATGAYPKPIGCKGEEQFMGKGLSYCATCDAGFFRNKPVYVIGGGDSAITEAIYLTKFARHVTVIHRRDALRAVKSLQDRAFQNEKISFLWDTTVEELYGAHLLSGMVVKNVKTGELTHMGADPSDGLFGVFSYIGYIPRSQLFEGVLDMEKGYIKTDEGMGTNIRGVFAAGDVRVKALRQVVTAAADGAIAAVSAEHYLDSEK